MVDVFTSLRAVGEIGVGLRVGEGERSCSRRYHPDEPLADPQSCPMYRFRSEPLGREEFQNLSRAHHVSRADLCHHLGSDNPNDAVEPLLRGARVRHNIAETAQEAAGSTDVPSGLRHPRASCLPNTPSTDRGARLHVCSSRAERAASACPTSSWRPSAALCSRLTNPTLCPAISEPASMSPSMTARRRAPAQKCSISSCAAFCDSSPRVNRSMTLRCTATNRSIAGLFNA